MIDKNLVIIYTLTFVDLFAVGLVFPVFQAHLLSLGISQVAIGALGSTYATIQVLSGPVVGSWSDIRGRKSVIRITLTLCSICYFLLGVLNTFSSIVILRILLGLFKQTQTICKAFIVDLYDSSKHAAILGKSSAFGSLGFVIGPLIGGHLFELQNGFFYITTLTSLLFIFNTVLVSQITTAPVKKKRVQNATVINAVVNEIKNIGLELKQINWSSYWDAFLLRFLFGLTISIYFSHHSLYLQKKFSLSQKYVGYMISFVGFGGVLTGLLLGHIKDKFYKNDQNCLSRIWTNFFSIVISFIGLHFSWSIYSYLIAVIPFAISSIILRNATMELVIKKTDKKSQGSLSGVSNSLMSISRSASPLLVSVFCSFYGDESVIVIALVPCVIGMLLSVLFNYKRHLVHKHID